MKTHIRSSPPHPVTGHEQSEITLHGGFEFLGASYLDGKAFEGMDPTPFYIIDLRAPGGEKLTLFVSPESVDEQAIAASLVARALAILVTFAKAAPNTTRHVDASGDLEPLAAAS